MIELIGAVAWLAIALITLAISSAARRADETAEAAAATDVGMAVGARLPGELRFTTLVNPDSRSPRR